ncbi:4-hydroxyphenylpyruvate dioxygenase [Candidatus Kaiserbacteria bacterium]|nr:4-hydroxyphenylpyruvate dioxygenase [Candidatus Kaiserbacteria bacterium]
MTKDSFPILGIDLEFFVRSAQTTAQFLVDIFGFTEVAYAARTYSTSRLLVQNDIRFIVTEGSGADSPVAQHVAKHGDGVRDIAFRVPDVREAYKKAMLRGAIAHMPPHYECDHYGTVVCAAIRTYGDTIHSLVERTRYSGLHLPGFEAVWSSPNPGIGLITIDHMVGNVERGQMNRWVKYYADVMGFTNLISFTDKDIKTEYTALMSKVMQNSTGKVKFPINEPASENKSHVDEYLHYNGGPGVQHIAMETKDIVTTVRTLRERGVEFSTIPRKYYDIVRKRFADVERVDIDTLAELSILADRDPDGYMLQIFTRPVVDRPTLFFEIIERQGSQSFGHGNFQALYEAKELEKAEREQAERGTL